ncbi:formylglycine-generating enzyme family protein [Luteimonas lutimaris]|uniref:Formylglycine-generating enzyme family protein n=1 Tax=Luteimonas lutimaris TaxID=698645 RepID=A0ABP7MUY9_9GAMM
MRGVFRIIVVALLLAGCSRSPGEAARDEPADDAPALREGIVTVSGDDAVSETLTWRAPAVEIPADGVDDVLERAGEALQAGNLAIDAGSAVPLYMALSKAAPDDARVRDGLRRALAAVIARGDAALAQAGDDISALREAHQMAAVARAVDGDDKAVLGYLERIDQADTLWDLNREGELALADGDYGEDGGGALAKFREALKLAPGQPRAMQGLAATESAMIRNAEIAADKADFEGAKRWLVAAAKIRPEMSTVPDAAARVERQRSARVARLRDLGVAALAQPDGLEQARRRLAEVLLIALPGDPAAADLRERIDLAEHYGQFRPGQQFTDGLKNGARGPQMVVVPHGAFYMGATKDDDQATDLERPRHPIRFARGLAMSITEVTVGDFRRFINATGRQTRAERRGYSMAYDERSGNFVRMSGVDWRSDYAGNPATDDLPVLHVSARDAEAYAEWLSEQSGHAYRLPSEAEFEYALRAGGATPYPWGTGAPPKGSGNYTGAKDRSPTGRHWNNAFDGYGDGFWGPAPAGRFDANAWQVRDLAGNVSEWVADCWHDGYRRAPSDGTAWLNPGCRTRVVRGGSWASAPVQTRSSWRAPAGVDSTNGRIGFRVVREI